MNITYGYTGKILRIDLSTGTVSLVETQQYLPDYPGGKAMSAKIYWDEIGPEVKPYDPENKLIFTTSPLNGSGAITASKCELATKAPGYWPGASYISSNASMLAPQLKRAGYDGLIIEGKAEKPVYIDINNDSVTIRDAEGIWGMDTFATREALWNEIGRDALVTCIGPAGENQVIFAAIMIDQCSCFARGGVGAVMGSKNLKAFSIRGTGRIAVAEPEALIEANVKRGSLFNIKFGEERIVHGQKIVGTPIEPWLGSGLNSPREGSALSEAAKKGELALKPAGCEGCAINCRTRYKFKDGSMPEGSLKCGLQATWVEEDDRYGDDPFTGRKNSPGRGTYAVSVLFDSLGLDGYVFPIRMPVRGITRKLTPEDDYGSTFAFGDYLWQAYLYGILTEENTGLPWSKLSTYEFYEKLLKMVAYKEGFGAVLAEGVGYTTEYIRTHEEFGPNRHEIDFLYHKAIPKKGRLGNAEINHGLYTPNPLRVMYSAVGDQQGQEPEPYWGGIGTCSLPDNVLEHYLGTTKIKDLYYWGPEIAEATIRHEDLSGIVDTYGVCCFMQFALTPSMGQFMPRKAEGAIHGEIFEWDKGCMENSDSGVPELLSCVSGEPVSHDDLMKMSERLTNLVRAIWVRDGYTSDGNQDLYWDELFEMKDQNGNFLTPKDAFLRTLEQYYEKRGWKAGVPTRAKLEELGLKYVADDLEQRGLLPA